MNTTAIKAHTSQISLKSYLALCKPKVVSLIVFTALAGFLLATPGIPSWMTLISAITGIGLAAAAGAAMNHWADRKIDGIMARTRNRPLPQSELSPAAVLVFAFSLATVSMVILVSQINQLTALLTFASMIGYAVIYTMFLKHSTPYNIVFGGAAGATPPLLGWTSQTGTISYEAISLFLIIFAWTPPHFWALAIKRRKEYAKANIPMLPVTHGVAFTKLQILLYTIILLAVSLLPFVLGMSGIIYLLAVMTLGTAFIWHASVLLLSSGDQYAGKTFSFSIIYLTILFAALLADHYVQMGTAIW